MLVPTLIAYNALRDARNALAWLGFLVGVHFVGTSFLDDGLPTATCIVVTVWSAGEFEVALSSILSPVKISFCCPEGKLVKARSDVSPTVCVSGVVTAVQRPVVFSVTDDDPCSLEDGVAVVECSVDTDLSYLVKTENQKLLRRNRRHLQESDDDIDTSSADNNVCGHPTVATSTSPANGRRREVPTSDDPSPPVVLQSTSPPKPALRRSTRTVKPPKRLHYDKDF
ncbi:hypothetical protein MRX96_002087 [Rhipicephalus microplus]